MLKPKRFRRGQRGLSIVEVMVGVAVGLFVVAAASMVVSSQLSSNRRLLLDTQLQQDLRVSADVVTRELRRAGAMLDTSALRTVWFAQESTATPIAVATAASASAVTRDESPTRLVYHYQRKDYGFRIDNGKLQSLTGSTWQDLTDANVMTVTAFTITPEVNASSMLPCPNDCPGGGQACWPTITVREYAIAITARAANDNTIQRSVRSRVRVANDLVTNNSGLTDSLCPL
jgi:type II secretory pathway component PulJ